MPVGDLSLTTLRVVVVEEHRTLVTGNKAPTLTELT